jgi:RNA polymerase sigma-70 factor (ECF subfamily)
MDRDDLRQEIAIAIWKAMPSFRGRASERSYVMRIAQNRAITFRLRLARNRALFRPLEVEPAALEAHSGEHELERLRAKLDSAIAKLPASQYELMALATAGLSPRQIATQTGKTAGSVRVALHRARETLRRWMHGDDTEPPSHTGDER